MGRSNITEIKTNLKPTAKNTICKRSKISEHLDKNKAKAFIFEYFTNAKPQQKNKPPEIEASSSLVEIKKPISSEQCIDLSDRKLSDSELANFEDMLLAEVIVDHLLSHLSKLKLSIEKSTDGRQLLGEIYSQSCLQKKELISKYTNSQNVLFLGNLNSQCITLSY